MSSCSNPNLAAQVINSCLFSAKPPCVDKTVSTLSPPTLLDFLYLCICICVFVRETLGNISFDILGPRAFRKCMVCMV